MSDNKDIEDFKKRVDMAHLLSEVNQAPVIRSDSVNHYKEQAVNLILALDDLAKSGKLDESQLALVQASAAFTASARMVADRLTDGREDFNTKNPEVIRFTADGINASVNQLGSNIDRRDGLRLFFESGVEKPTDLVDSLLKGSNYASALPECEELEKVKIVASDLKLSGIQDTLSPAFNALKGKLDLTPVAEVIAGHTR